MTAFTDLPESSHPDYRMVGSCLMDEEQFRVEEWHLYRDTEWRPTVAGIHRYAQLRASRKDDRKSAWQARVDRDDEWSDSITALIEEKGQ